MKIEETLNPSSKDIDYLTQKVTDNPEFTPIQPFGFFIRNNGKIIAGCNGVVIYGAIYTDNLWVDKNYRKAGLGRKLMERVHELGYRSGCQMATVATMSFQNAVPFYEKLGYVVDFERKGYNQNSSCLFLSRKLD